MVEETGVHETLDGNENIKEEKTSDNNGDCSEELPIDKE